VWLQCGKCTAISAVKRVRCSSDARTKCRTFIGAARRMRLGVKRGEDAQQQRDTRKPAAAATGRWRGGRGGTYIRNQNEAFLRKFSPEMRMSLPNVSACSGAHLKSCASRAYSSLIMARRRSMSSMAAARCSSSISFCSSWRVFPPCRHCYAPARGLRPFAAITLRSWCSCQEAMPPAMKRCLAASFCA
jgi:hypothetical protein